MSSRPELLRLAFAGLSPDRVATLIDAASADEVVARMLAGRIDVPEEARRRLSVPAEEREGQLRESGVGFLHGGLLPPCLSPLPHAPRWLFVRGALPPLPGVAVVGSRRASGYGLGVAERLGRALSSWGIPVVSGLAAGIDGAAHRGCLAGRGTAVAVLGSGIDVWYPARHRQLGEHLLAKGGSVVSEFPPGTPPEPWRFPARNRIISGLSSVVVVVEAAVRSGALITARTALEQGREVIAVPGDIDRPTSAGCNLLIRDGAHPLTAVEDLGEMLGLMLGSGRADGAELPPRWRSILGPYPRPLDEAVVESGLSPGEAMAELARLELAGALRIEGGTVRSV